LVGIQALDRLPDGLLLTVCSRRDDRRNCQDPWIDGIRAPSATRGPDNRPTNQQERWQLGGTASEIYEQHLVPAIFRPWALLLVEQADLQPGERVLDAACGAGVVARLAASHAGLGGHVTGMDLNQGCWQWLERFPRAEGAPVEWSEGDATDMPLSSGVFDVICCQLGLQYFPDRPQALGSQ
jgi:SAM-dependent methyltransferase